MKAETSQEQAKYFKRDDYAGFIRRSIIIVLDIAVLWGLWFAMAYAKYFSTDYDPDYKITLCSWYAFVALYLTVIKKTIGTVGYRVMDVKIVDHRGKSPSIWRMLLRFLLLILGPFHPIIDLVWLSGDYRKQALRDKFTGVYVVRRNASPVGTGVVVAVTYHFLGLAIMCLEIEPGPRDGDEAARLSAPPEVDP